MYNPHALSISAFLNTVKCLTDHLRYPYDIDYLAWLCTQQSFQVTSLSDKITIRLIRAFAGLNIYKKANLGITSSSLVTMVKILNSFDHAEGFLYEKKLEQQSQIIIPQPIFYNSFWEDIIAPIQRLHLNSSVITDPLIPIGFILLFIAMINSHIQTEISEVDWSCIVFEILYPRVSLDDLPLRAAEIMTASNLNKQLQANNFCLPEAQYTNPEVKNDK